MSSSDELTLKERAHNIAKLRCQCSCGKNVPFGCEWMGYRILESMAQTDIKEKRKEALAKARKEKTEKRLELERQSRERTRSIAIQQEFDSE